MSLENRQGAWGSHAIPDARHNRGDAAERLHFASKARGKPDEYSGVTTLFA